LVPSDDGGKSPRKSSAASDEGESHSTDESSQISANKQQQHGVHTGEASVDTKQGDHAGVDTAVDTAGSSLDGIQKSPGEVAFFKLLHVEYKKVTHFFEKAQQEFIIREERVREGMEIMKKPNSIMVSEKWSLLAKSLYRLYKDLLLLETFAIMSYCSFSKILKKHDKVTGYNTRQAFMANVVANANFTNYPVLLEMIKRCEKMYEEVSQRLQKEGKEGLYEDERLFINMIHRLNEQCMDTAESEGGPERKEPRRTSVVGQDLPMTASSSDCKASNTLRSLVADMDSKAQGQVSEGQEGDESDSDRKRPAMETPDSKRPRTEK
jgi:hypothetical protein